MMHFMQHLNYLAISNSKTAMCSSAAHIVIKIEKDLNHFESHSSIHSNEISLNSHNLGHRARYFNSFYKCIHSGYSEFKQQFSSYIMIIKSLSTFSIQGKHAPAQYTYALHLLSMIL